MRSALLHVVATAMLLAAFAPAASAAPTAASGNFVCTLKWTTVHNVPSGYAIGNCGNSVPNSVHLHRTWKDYADGRYWDGGYTFGNFQGCGWVRSDEDAKVAEGTFTACGSSASRGLSDFAAFTNDIVARGLKDGTGVRQTAACPEYANYRPWSTSNAPADYLRTSSPPGQLLWRYATRYSSANGTGQYVMVRDNAVAHGDGNWVFVPRSCLRLTDTLNPGQTLSLFKESLISRDGRYGAVMQEDGNFVVYNASTYLWHTHTYGYNGAYLIMQTDGNLVIYWPGCGGCPIWNSGTQGNPGAYLIMQTDGNLVIYNGGRALWSWMTGRLY